MPADIPVTIPVETPTVATDVLLLVQVPPPLPLREVVVPIHMNGVPVIADGGG